MATDPDIQLPRGVGTFNEAFFDGLVRHQIGLLRLAGSVREEVFRLLDATEADLAEQIRRRLAGHQGFDSPRSVQRMQTLLRVIRGTRARAWREVNKMWVERAIELSAEEPSFTDNILKMAVPVHIETVIPAAAFLGEIARSRPFEGRTLSEWAAHQRAADLQRIEDAVRVGMIQGESAAAIARRVFGTRAQAGRDGVTQLTRNAAAAITRTMINAMSNQARREFYRANPGVFRRELYVATLDARTTPVCRSLDGELFPLGRGPIPPLHFNCRSLRVAVISDEFVGSRPARAFTQRGLLREYAQREGIGPVTARDRLPRGHKGAFDTFARARMRELTGRVPSKVTYQDWLGRQSAQFQDDVLGRTRGRLFRAGGLTLDRFVNRAGDELPLRELARRDREAFIQAGLDPEDFL